MQGESPSLCISSCRDFDFSHPGHPLSPHILMVTSSVKNFDETTTTTTFLSPSAVGCYNIPFGQGSVRRATGFSQTKRRDSCLARAVEREKSTHQRLSLSPPPSLPVPEPSLFSHPGHPFSPHIPLMVTAAPKISTQQLENLYLSSSKKSENPISHLQPEPQPILASYAAVSAFLSGGGQFAGSQRRRREMKRLLALRRQPKSTYSESEENIEPGSSILAAPNISLMITASI